MTASMAKKIADLEAALWSKADIIYVHDGEVSDILHSIKPLGVPLCNRWYAEDAEIPKISRRLTHIEKSLLSPHPAFLEKDEEIIRRVQWCLHKSDDYRRLLEEYWRRFLEYFKAQYDLKEGLLAVSLRLFEKEIDGWQAEYKYLGLERSREEMAENQIALWRQVEKVRDKKGEPENKKSNQAVWNQAALEYLRELYGREITERELELEYQMWRELKKDMETGKPASESEAASYLRDMIERYPRKTAEEKPRKASFVS